MIRKSLMIMLFLLWQSAHASTTTDLQGLVTQGETLNGELAAFSFAQEGSCSELGTLNTSMKEYIASIQMVYTHIPSPYSVSIDDLDSLDSLAALALQMAQNSFRISTGLQTSGSCYERSNFELLTAAMLRLSDDIGTMADRILEMADRILVMADNIGIMADRILITQQLQNANVRLTQESVLQTQNNMIALSDALMPEIYDATLADLITKSQALADAMAATTLSETTMDVQLQQLEVNASRLMISTKNLYEWAAKNNQLAVIEPSDGTLTMFGDLSQIHQGMGDSLQTFAAAIESLSDQTDSAVLKAAIANMLKLSYDVGTMSNRIMEMSDKIIVMADNIGIMTDRIRQTQELQQGSFETMFHSMFSAQSAMITLFQSMNP
ncbi:hypothetical protein WCX72_07900 [Sulfurimonas sp. HSL1-6]|uniref:hypothetical protein n=1 Tax=Thiomicrolovo immobilis TaxID=3131935 RepID=UPI0031F8267A